MGLINFRSTLIMLMCGEKTRLEICTLWSTLTFQRCSSRHITQAIVALWSEVTVASWPFLHWCDPRSLFRNNVSQQRSFFPLLSNNVFQRWHPGHVGCLPRIRNAIDRWTGRHARAHKVFFAHARPWRTPRSQRLCWMKQGNWSRSKRRENI
jgi:hypothetical protein